MMKTIALSYLLFQARTYAQNISTSTVLQGSTNCPPDGFDALQDFDFEAFITPARWYAIQQKEVRFQSLDTFYCVYAEYTPWGFCPLCLGRPKIKVFNHAREGSVTGSSNTVNFQAIVTRPRRHPARALVGPRFLPTLGLLPRSNYWVVDAGTYADILADVPSPSGPPYEWAIITAGSPKSEGDFKLCSPRLGMWMFARDPDVSEEVQDAIRLRAANMGLDINEWIPVQHEGCGYEE